ncbi:MAG: COR domain-containing protein, partial [Cyanobacteria bacterium P01_E01_bin.42]
PVEIGQFSSLQSFNLRRNLLKTLPPEIGCLTSLNFFDLEDNCLTEVPAGIGSLSSLQFLNIKKNKFRKLPPEIGNLVSLQSLDLRENKLRKLPPEIGNLVSLQSLNLARNLLKELPLEIGYLSSLQLFNVGNNPLFITPELNKEDGIEIRDFYRQKLQQGIDRIYEAKLLLVGEGGAGKTTLSKKIEDEKYELVSNEQSTEGIDIIRWTFPLKDNREFVVNIWDFGGQEIYHATHQFFLTKRSLYILVADSRKEDTDFFYWLNVVELLSETSPILIVQNEKQDRKREINERQLRGEFLNLKEVISSNLANNRGLFDIKQNIEHYITSLPHVGDKLPKTWVTVRKALETNPHNYITLEKYLEICQEYGFARRKDALQLSGYLHDLGVCLHFQEDDLLHKTVILKPTWGTDAVYRVLDNPQVIKNLGHFSRDDLAIIWHEEQYAIMCPELLRLMMNFKLCYEIPSSLNNYIAPQLLSPNSPEYTWDQTNILLLRYSYIFMPKGILTRFIVEMHQWIENQTCVWKTGVVLSQDYARAEIIELYHRKEIHIRICGDRRRDLLTTIRYEFNKIHKTYERLKYNILVPCNCMVCTDNQNPHFYIYDKLIERISNKKKTIECGNPPYDDVKISGLIDDIEPTIFFSDRPENRDRNLGRIQSILLRNMSNSRNNNFNAEQITYIENNAGDAIGQQYTSDRDLAESLDAIAQIFKELSHIHATTDEQEIEVIIEAEVEKIKERDPHRWRTLKRKFFNPKRWLSGGRAAAIEIVNHYVDESAWGKGIIAFLDKVSEEE